MSDRLRGGISDAELTTLLQEFREKCDIIEQIAKWETARIKSYPTNMVLSRLQVVAMAESRNALKQFHEEIMALAAIQFGHTLAS